MLRVPLCGVSTGWVLVLEDLRDDSSSGTLLWAQHGFTWNRGHGEVPGPEKCLKPVAVQLPWHLTVPSLVSPQCIVIGLQSTGEARTREVLDENDGHLNCFVSAAE